MGSGLCAMEPPHSLLPALPPSSTAELCLSLFPWSTVDSYNLLIKQHILFFPLQDVAQFGIQELRQEVSRLVLDGLTVCHSARSKGRLNQNEKQTALSKLEVMMGGGDEHFGGCQIFFELLSTYTLCFPLIYHLIGLSIRMTKMSRASDNERHSAVVPHALHNSHCRPCRLWQCPPGCPRREMTTECLTETLVTSLSIAEKFVAFGMLGVCHCDSPALTAAFNSGSVTNSLCLSSTAQSYPFYPLSVIWTTE